WGEQFVGIWRVMFVFAGIPAVLLLLGMARLPESPRWLVAKGRADEALTILETLRPEGRAVPELADISCSQEAEARRSTMSLAEILSNKNLVKIVLIGCGLAFFQQTTGINSILYYGEKVLHESGFTHGGALIANIAPAAISVLAAIIALQMMDRVSRRKTFLWGYGLVALFHLLIGLAAVTIPEKPDSLLKPFALLALITLFVG